MKAIVLLLGVVLLSPALSAAPQKAVKVLGLAQINGTATALFELRSPEESKFKETLLLQQGQADNGIVFRSYDPKSGEIQVVNGVQTMVIPWSAAGRTLDFEEVPLGLALEFYSRQTRQTFLHGSSLPVTQRISVQSGANDSLDAALLLLKSACIEKGLVWREAGEKFIFLARQNEAESMSAIAAKFSKALVQPEPAIGTGKERRMTPVINFNNMPLGQVLDFYSQIANRAVLRGATLPVTTFIKLKSGSAFTESETIAALEAVMALNGIAVIPAGNRFVFVVRSGEVSPLAKIIETSTARLVAAEKTEGDAPTNSPVPLVNFNNMPLGHVLTFYSDLCRRAVLCPATLPITTFISFKSRGPMKKAETIAAVEAVMALNGIVVVPVRDKFALAVVQGKAETVEKVADKLSQELVKIEQARDAGKPDQSASALNFDGMPLTNALAAYAEMTGKTLAEGFLPKFPFVILKDNGQLSRQEMIAGLEAVFSLNGVELHGANGQPLKVLMGLSFSETRHEHLVWPEGERYSPENGMPRPYGIMSLWDNEFFGHSLIDAAKLIGKDPEVLKADPLQNMRGAAALLRKYYEETDKPKYAKPDSLESWKYALMKYSALPEPDLAHQHAFDVYDFLTQGYDQYGIKLPEVPDLDLKEMWDETKKIKEEQRKLNEEKWRKEGRMDDAILEEYQGPDGMWYAREVTTNGTNHVSAEASQGPAAVHSAAAAKKAAPVEVAAVEPPSNKLWLIIGAAIALLVVGWLVMRGKAPEARK